MPQAVAVQEAPDRVGDEPVERFGATMPAWTRAAMPCIVANSTRTIRAPCDAAGAGAGSTST